MEDITYGLKELSVSNSCFCKKKRGWYPKCVYCLKRIPISEYEKHSKKFKKKCKSKPKLNIITCENGYIPNKEFPYTVQELLDDPEKYRPILAEEERKFWGGERPWWMKSRKPTYVFEELEL